MDNKEWISYQKIITFNGKTFGGRVVNIKGYGERLIAGLELQKELIKDDEYVSNVARYIDEEIFYYVEDKALNFGDKQLAEKVRKEME